MADTGAGVKESPVKIRVLDAGCGSGRDMVGFEKSNLWINGQYVPVEASGFDVCTGFVELCHKRGLTRAVIADFSSYFKMEPDCMFDGIFSLAALIHVPLEEIPAILKQFHDHLNPESGFLLITLPDGNQNQMDCDDTAVPAEDQLKMLETAGFTTFHTQKVWMYNQNWFVTVSRIKQQKLE